mmetsp:Transcript_64626/g.189067  ORF Transcript_64626/g.189067 Transcript_64626/m.189067 type:complete len:321 (-) Transcript_64626:979-1941(-)
MTLATCWHHSGNTLGPVWQTALAVDQSSEADSTWPSASIPVAISFIRLLSLFHGQAQVLIRTPSVPIAEVRVLHLVLLGQEGVAMLEGEELVQGGEEREERPSKLPLPLEVGELEDALRLGRDHVVHLAENVREGDRVVVQALHALHLLLVEVLHLVVADAAAAVEVKHVEPVLHRPVRLPVLVAEQEADEVLVAHLPRHGRVELRRDLTEDPVDGAARERVPVVLEQVVLVQQEVMVGVQLPERAVDHVELLVAEVVADHLDVVMVRELLPSLGHGRLVAAKTVQMDAPNVLAVINEEDSTDHRVCVAVLELLGFPEEV